MSLIGKNIRKIRTVKGYSQAAFAELFAIKRANIGAYEEGRAEPKTDMIIKIAKHFSISIDLLLTKELTVNELSGFQLIRPGAKQESAAVRLPFISSEKQNEFIQRPQDENWLNSLPALVFPQGWIEAELAIEWSKDGISDSVPVQNGEVFLLSLIKPEELNGSSNGTYIWIAGEALHLGDQTQFSSFASTHNNPATAWKVEARINKTGQVPAQDLESRLIALEQTVRKLAERG